MKACIVLMSLIVAAYAQRYQDYNTYPDQPIPYSFSYTAPGEEGESSHQETGDGNGRVQGSYSLRDVDGRSRIVEYVADEGGFRAIVRTNEPGTASQNPADVVFESTADQYQGGAPVQPRPVVQRQPARQGGYVLVPVESLRGGGGGYY